MSPKVRMTAKVRGRLAEPRVRHLQGLPPELTGGVDRRERMAAPDLLVIEERPDGFFLFRFTAGGQPVGDTWHRSIEESQEQARFEYGDLISDWRVVPAGIEDVVAFGLRD